jgi:hypothetical protein
MQPSPIAETRGPVDPSCRVITRKPLYFEVLGQPTQPTSAAAFWRPSSARGAALKRQEEDGDADDGDAEEGGGITPSRRKACGTE